jgi:uncharacterized protein YdaU (DUF1376 family)
MRTYSLKRLADFILFIFEKEQEDILWDVWLHKDVNEDFKTFKKKKMRTIRKKKVKSVSKDDEQKAIALASRFIKTTDHKEGGEMNDK